MTSVNTEAHAHQSLEDITVVDLSRVLGGPYCTQILADHGARVIKIEPPQGDDTRSWGPPFLDDDRSWYFAGANRNKQSRALDLKDPEDREELNSLLAEADVLVENFKSGTMESWGLGRDELRKQHPHLIHASITGFGDDGPLGGLPGYDAIIQAMTGLMSVNGTPDSGPTRIGMPAVDMISGLYAVNGILMALHERTRSGRGQHVDIALYDCALSVMHPHMPNFFGSGKSGTPTGNDHPNIAPYSTYSAGDGQLFFAVGNNGQFRRLVEYLGVPELADDPRFADNADRLANRPALREVLEAAMADQNIEDLGTELMKRGVPVGPILNTQQAADHPHTQARQMIVELEDGYKGVASPIKLERTPAKYHTPPPARPKVAVHPKSNN